MRSLREAIKLFWTFRVPWGWTYTAGTVADWVAQFSFGFYSLMLTSLLLGLIVMVFYKPHGTRNVQNSLMASRRDAATAATRYVWNTMLPNIVRKKIKKP